MAACLRSHHTGRPAILRAKIYLRAIRNTLTPRGASPAHARRHMRAIGGNPQMTGHLRITRVQATIWAQARDAMQTARSIPPRRGLACVPRRKMGTDKQTDRTAI